MIPKFCPACRRPTRPGLSFCTNCNYFLGQPSLEPPVASQVEIRVELVLVFLVAAAILVAVGVLLTAPAS
jgi:hypothetical protein